MPNASPDIDHRGLNERLTLAFLWTWVLFNYVYGDILHIFMIFMNPALQAQLERGAIGGISLNDTATLIMAAVMELSLAMAFLAWKLPYRMNRLLNIMVGVLFTLIMVAVLFGRGRIPPASGYTFYGLVEIVLTSAIVLFAWRWRDQDRNAGQGEIED